MWLTPFLIEHLGVALFGFVPLANSTAQYLGIITGALSSTLGRYLTVAISAGDARRAQSAFTTGIIAESVTVGVLLPVVFVGAWLLGRYLDTPPESAADVTWLLFATGLAFLLSAWSSCLSSLTFAFARFDLRSGVEAASLLLRVALIYMLFVGGHASLLVAGLASVCAAVLRILLYGVTWRKLAPGIRPSRELVDWAQFRSMMSTGGWMMLNQVGAIALTQLDLVLANLLLGAKAAGLYAPMVQFSALLLGYGSAIATVAMPKIIGDQSTRGPDDVVRTTASAMRLTGVAVALPIGLLCGLSYPLLNVWLDAGFAELAPIMAVVTFARVSLCAKPLMTVPLAVNRVGVPALFLIGLAVIYIPAAIGCTQTWNMGLWGIVVPKTILLLANACVFMPLFAAKILGVRPRPFFAALAPTVVSAALLSVAGWALHLWLELNSWPALILAGSGLSVVFCPAAFALALRRRERDLVLRAFRRGSAEHDSDGGPGGEGHA
jgi:membrane protein EpsK